MSNNHPSSKIIDLRLVLWFSKILMIFAFIILSYIPLVSTILFFLPQIPLGDVSILTTYIIIVLIIWGLGTIFGLLTMSLRFRGLGTTLFTVGILLSSSNPYILSLGIVLSWIFFEFWSVVSQSQRFLRDYSSYSTDCLERKKLINVFQNQIISFGFFAWMVLFLTWAVLFLAENFYIELGKEFGSTGIFLSLAIVTLILLFQKLHGPMPKAGE